MSAARQADFEASPITEWRLAAARNGYTPTPVFGKNPAPQGWQNKHTVSDDEIKPDADTISGRVREKALLAGFAAEAQTPMMMGDKTEFSITFRATICFDAHRCTSNFERLRLK